MEAFSHECVSALCSHVLSDDHIHDVPGKILNICGGAAGTPGQ